MATVWYFSQTTIDAGGVGARYSSHNGGSLKIRNEMPAREGISVPRADNIEYIRKCNLRQQLKQNLLWGSKFLLMDERKDIQGIVTRD